MSVLSAEQGGKNHVLLNTIKESRGLKNDAALARFLEVPPAFLSKIRTGKEPVAASMLLRVLDLEIMNISPGAPGRCQGQGRRLQGPR